LKPVTLKSKAREDGLIIDAVDTDTMAVTILAIMEGSLSAAKVSRNLDKLYQGGCGLIQLLQLIRTIPGSD